MGGMRSGHGIKRPDHAFVQGGREPTGQWVTVPIRKRNESKIRHSKSLFSNLPDPSLNRDRIKRLNLSKKELKMRDEQRKKIASEAKDIQQLARQFALDAMQVLAEVMQSPDAADTAKITAANSLLDRAYGKAAVTNVNVNANMDANPKDLDSRDLDQRIADTLNRVEKLTDRASEEAEGEKRPVNLRQYN